MFRNVKQRIRKLSKPSREDSSSKEPDGDNNKVSIEILIHLK